MEKEKEEKRVAEGKRRETIIKRMKGEKQGKGRSKKENE